MEAPCYGGCGFQNLRKKFGAEKIDIKHKSRIFVRPQIREMPCHRELKN